MHGFYLEAHKALAQMNLFIKLFNVFYKLFHYIPVNSSSLLAFLKNILYS